MEEMAPFGKPGPELGMGVGGGEVPANLLRNLRVMCGRACESTPPSVGTSTTTLSEDMGTRTNNSPFAVLLLSGSAPSFFDALEQPLADAFSSSLPLVFHPRFLLIESQVNAILCMPLLEGY
ncbi:hypothetical protein A0H81_05964 [Grifola frondosa]|uniref:Uncharacterized protein n=1 Tax=Grifola frondosa TaxID=5627 RepID=A0A1C7MBE6_GRIFR|nr:hypothetical protein A0H81_05964 [Grifola frondosa]